MAEEGGIDDADVSHSRAFQFLSELHTEGKLTQAQVRRAGCDVVLLPRCLRSSCMLRRGSIQLQFLFFLLFCFYYHAFYVCACGGGDLPADAGQVEYFKSKYAKLHEAVLQT